MTALWREFDAEAEDVRARIRSENQAGEASAKARRDLVVHRWSDAVRTGWDINEGENHKETKQ